MTLKHFLAMLLALTACANSSPSTRPADAGAAGADAADGGRTMPTPADAGGRDAFDASQVGDGAIAADAMPSGSPLDAASPDASLPSPRDSGMDASVVQPRDAMANDAGSGSHDAGTRDASGDHGNDSGHQPDAALWPNATVAENAKPGTTTWQLSNPASAREIEGYASKPSVNLGESVNLFVSTAAPTYTVEIYRLGWYAGTGARLVLAAQTRAGVMQAMPVPDADGLIECNWTQPLTVSPGSDWGSGVYLAKLTESTAGKQAFVPFVVRDDARASDYLVQSSVNTFQAYNNWGGKSLYDFNSAGMTRASKVSFHRPYGLGANVEAAAGLGAGEILTNFQAKPQTAAAGWEYSMIRFLEREGFDVSYATSVDTHRNSELLRGHKAFLSVGHDEYWSWEMRRTVEDGRDRFGTSVGFFSGNVAYWQVRYEPETGPDAFTRIVCYKDAPPGDPYLGTSEAYRTTVRWSTPPLLRPESALHGLAFENFGVNADAMVTDPEHWMLADTGLATGDLIPGLVGYEVDVIAAYPRAGVLRFAHSPYTSAQGNGYSDMLSFAVPSGAEVVAVGSIQFAWGVDDFRVSGVVGAAPVSPAAQAMVRNALARFAAPHAGPAPGTIVLDETFASARDPSRWRQSIMSEGLDAYDPAVGVTQVGEQLRIAPLAATTGLHHAGYVSSRAFDLTNSSVHLEVVQVANAATAADTTFAIGLDSANCYRFTVESSTLVMQRKSGGSVMSLSLAYDAVTQRWWRFRHDPLTQMMYWETSPDGITWQTRHSETVSLSPSKLFLEVEAGTYEAELSPGLAIFDNLQVEQLGMSETFDNSRNPEHFAPEVLHLGAGAFDAVLPVFGFGGVLHIRPLVSASGAHYGGYASTRTWNLSGGLVSIEVVQVASGAAQTILALTQSATDYARIVAQSGSLSFQVSVGGALSSISVPYDMTAQRFWRIRHDGSANQLVWETSPDGAAWTEQRRVAAQLTVSAVRAELAAGTAAPETTPGEAQFDNFTLSR